MHRVFVAAVAAAMLGFAACGGGGDESAPSAPTATATATPTVSAATPEAWPTATPENLTPAVTATAAAPTPAVEAVTPITQQTNPTPIGGAQSPAAPTPTPPAAENPTSATVGVSGIGRFFWSPGKVTVAAGGTVTWAWSGNDFHDVRVDALGYSSGDPAKQGSYTLTFPSAGTYAVSCTIHTDTMRGTVVVE